MSLGKVAIVKIVTPDGKEVTAFEYASKSKAITISDVVKEADPEIVRLVRALTDYIENKEPQ